MTTMEQAEEFGIQLQRITDLSHTLYQRTNDPNWGILHLILQIFIWAIINNCYDEFLKHISIFLDKHDITRN